MSDVYALASSKPWVLTRPRRFGKSTLLSTIAELFRHGVKPYDGHDSYFNSMMPEVPILFQGGDEWHPDMLRFAWVQRTLLSMRTDRAVRKTR